MDRHETYRSFTTAVEKERLEELYALGLLDTASELRFDRYTSLVAELFGFPIVLITFVDQDRQWFKSSCGLDLKQTSRDISFCSHTIEQPGGGMVILDTHNDPRFAENPLVTGPPYIRFYAGAVVHGPTGKPLGSLCTIDHVPRKFNAQQWILLRQFAELVENEISHAHDLQTLRASVEYSAYYDALTGLPNRRLLTDRLGKLLETGESETRQVAVLLFNIAELRLINQSFGSDVGDAMLTQVGERLEACCPLGGTVARLQADEFVMAFAAGTESAMTHIDRVAEQACAAMSKPFFSSSGERYLHVQMGGSVFPHHGTTPSALIERASAAIRFEGKGVGGGIRYFSRADSLSITDRLEIESHLHRALEQEQFHLVYQPIVSLGDGRVTCVEALIRWSESSLGDISPERFIPVAEHIGLILPLGRWVQQEVCSQLKQWAAEGLTDITVAINVAAPELLQPDYANALLERMKNDGVSPQQLYLEMTERLLVNDDEAVRGNLDQLNQAQVQVNIDDFGTGYSSLAYLRRLHIGSLKIDRSFIHGLPDEAQDVTLTNTILKMAEGLSLHTVAEGIETESQLDFLRQTRCDYGQGFFISKPVSAAEVPALCNRALV